MLLVCDSYRLLVVVLQLRVMEQRHRMLQLRQVPPRTHKRTTISLFDVEENCVTIRRQLTSVVATVVASGVDSSSPSKPHGSSSAILLFYFSLCEWKREGKIVKKSEIYSRIENSSQRFGGGAQSQSTERVNRQTTYVYYYLDGYANANWLYFNFVRKTLLRFCDVCECIRCLYLHSGQDKTQTRLSNGTFSLIYNQLWSSNCVCERENHMHIALCCTCRARSDGAFKHCGCGRIKSIAWIGIDEWLELVSVSSEAFFVGIGKWLSRINCRESR